METGYIEICQEAENPKAAWRELVLETARQKRAIKAQDFDGEMATIDQVRYWSAQGYIWADVRKEQSHGQRRHTLYVDPEQVTWFASLPLQIRRNLLKAARRHDVDPAQMYYYKSRWKWVRETTDVS